MRALSAFLSVWMLLCAFAAWAQPAYLNLREHWDLQSAAKFQADGAAVSTTGFVADSWYKTSVPRTVLAALVDNGVYPDPFYGENLRQIPGFQEGSWLVMKEDSPFWPSWWYRTEFDVPADWKDKHVVLHLDGINFRANVWLNGVRIADSDRVVGMFRRFEFDVNAQLRFGEKNCLAVEIIAPGHIPKKNYHTKQVEATTGWDDHNPQPPDLNMGIWQDVYLTATGPVALRHPYVASDLDLPSLDVAHLSVEAYAVNKTDAAVTGTLAGNIENISFSQEVTLQPKETLVVHFTPEAFSQLNLKSPRIWWPVNVGKQELYEVELTFTVDGSASDTARTSFGIREATTYINDEGWRGYQVNGKNILIRGGAWMTSDMLLRLTPHRYNALVRYAAEGNLNMLRSEGFSIRETEDFYNACDRYGVMATQQIFGRSIPDEELAVDCIRDMMLRIRNHPSLVHFLGHDETFPTETLDAAYKKLIADLDVRRTYQPHSGAFEIEERFQTGGTRTGSLQVWTYAPPNHYYISEDTGAWGFAQSGGIGGIFASKESLHRMMPEEALWPPFSKTWSFHTVIQGAHYFSPVFKAIQDRYGKVENADDLIRKGLALNYECARGMFEAYGREKYKATGITTWKYDAAWPAAQTWHYIDWYLIPTAGYYGAKKACEPLHVQYSYDNDTVYVVNARYRDEKGLKVTARVLNQDLSEKFQKSVTVDVAADGKTNAFTIEWPEGLSTTYFLLLKLEDAEGKTVSNNFYWLSTVRDVPHKLEQYFANPVSTADMKALASLPPVELKSTVSHGEKDAESCTTVTLENPSGNLAFLVRLALTKGEGGAEASPVFWSDNYFALLPGESREIRALYSAQDLEGAAPAVKIDGWNVAQ